MNEDKGFKQNVQYIVFYVCTANCTIKLLKDIETFIIRLKWSAILSEFLNLHYLSLLNMNSFRYL